MAMTWQSLSERKDWVLPEPMLPQPTIPMVMRCEGAVEPLRPSALPGINVGSDRAVPVAARKRRREIFDVVRVRGITDSRLYEAVDDSLKQRLGRLKT